MKDIKEIVKLDFRNAAWHEASHIIAAKHFEALPSYLNLTDLVDMNVDLRKPLTLKTVEANVYLNVRRKGADYAIIGLAGECATLLLSKPESSVHDLADDLCLSHEDEPECFSVSDRRMFEPCLTDGSFYETAQFVLGNIEQIEALANKLIEQYTPLIEFELSHASLKPNL